MNCTRIYFIKDCLNIFRCGYNLNLVYRVAIKCQLIAITVSFKWTLCIILNLSAFSSYKFVPFCSILPLYSVDIVIKMVLVCNYAARKCGHFVDKHTETVCLYALISKTTWSILKLFSFFKSLCLSYKCRLEIKIKNADW